MEILLSFCLRCLSRTASMTLRVSGSFLEPSLLRISAKNRKKWLLSSLALYFQMTLGCRPHLPSIDPSLSSVDCIFFFTVSLFGELLYFVPGNFREPGHYFLEKQKKTNKQQKRAPMLLSWLPRYTICFSVLPLLRRNTTIINESNFWNSLAYIITCYIATKWHLHFVLKTALRIKILQCLFFAQYLRLKRNQKPSDRPSEQTPGSLMHSHS